MESKNVIISTHKLDRKSILWTLTDWAMLSTVKSFYKKNIFLFPAVRPKIDSWTQESQMLLH